MCLKDNLLLQVKYCFIMYLINLQMSKKTHKAYAKNGFLSRIFKNSTAYPFHVISFDCSVSRILIKFTCSSKSLCFFRFAKNMK
jgi:hypothetical protein